MTDPKAATTRPDVEAVHEALRAKTEELDRYFANSLDLLCIASTAGRFLRVNPQWTQVLGYPLEELVGRSFLELVHEEDLPATLRAVSALSAHQPVIRFVNRYRCRDGSYRWLEWNSHPVGDAIYAVARDITERKLTEAGLNESRQLYEDLVAHVNVGVFRTEQEGHRGFRFVYVSDRYCAQLGLTREAILADPSVTMDLIVPEDRAGFDRANAEAIRHRAPLSWEGRVLVRGQTRWLRVDSNPSSSGSGRNYWTGVVADVTEQKHAHQALEMFRFATDQAADAVFWLNEAGGFLYVNDQACRSLGYARDELMACTLFDVDPVYTRPAWAADWTRDDELQWRHVESQHRRKDGTVFPVEVWARRFWFSDREMKVAFARDISERRRAEQSRLDLERRLLNAQKLESLGELAGGVAHDFNNLLMAMLGNLDIVLAHTLAASPMRGPLEDSIAAAQRAADLTRQMLAYSGRASVSVGDVQLNKVVDENVPLLRTGISKLITIQVQADPDLPVIKADAGGIQQILVNLTTNAAEAIGDRRGLVTISTGASDCDAAYLQGSRTAEVPAPGRYAYLEVTDNGSGMDDRTLERLFDPFFTTKFMGRGLGMAAIQGIVRAHRGGIFVSSTPGVGSTIRVCFPVPAPAPSIRQAGPPPTAEKTPAKGRILVVDDEEMVRKVCVRMLQQAGWQVVDASGGALAVDVMARYGGDIDCVLLDLSMPDMDGLTTFRQLRALKPDVKVILSSGYTHDQDDGYDLFSEGLAGFIQKPYSARQLREELSRVLGPAPGDTTR